MGYKRTHIMGWISFCLFALLISSCHLKPVEEEEEANGKEVMLEARETPKEDMADTGAAVNEDEIKKYNDYMDAVYRRMNAALRAKLMDPMELNLDAKDEREGKKKNKKDSAKRVTREAGKEIMEAEELLMKTRWTEWGNWMMRSIGLERLK